MRQMQKGTEQQKRAAWEAARELVDVIEPILMEGERRLALEEFFTIVLNAIKSASASELAALVPSPN